MKEIVGSPGTVSGMALRVGQCACAGASIGFMVSALGFSNYTAFCYLIASMGLQVLWSFGLACLDVYALKRKRDLQNPVLVSLFVVGDWVSSYHDTFVRKRPAMPNPKLPSQVTATLSLAAACSSAGVIVLYSRDLHFCREHMHLPCGRFQLSVALAFCTWVLIAMSSHVMFWILASI